VLYVIRRVPVALRSGLTPMAVSRPTRSEEVENTLLNQLGELADAEGRLPTEAELSARFNVSRGTIRSAVGSLVARSLLVRRQGKGTFVNQIARIGNPLDQAMDFCEIITRNGCQPAIRYVQSVVAEADPDSARGLELNGEPVLYRHAIFTADGDPVIYCINVLPLWVMPASLAQEVVANPAISEPLYDFLESRCGHRIEFHSASIWPDVAQNCQMRETICEPLTPVLVIDETGFDVNRRPVLRSVEYYPGRFMRFELVRRRVARFQSGNPEV
jgi:GntR family transcriptional regulator